MIGDDDGWNTDERCPHCGKTIVDLWEHLQNVMGESFNMDCPYCEKSIRVKEWTQYIMTKAKPRFEDTNGKANSTISHTRQHSNMETT